MAEFIMDETIIKVGSEYAWLWIAIEPKNKEVPALNISRERNTFVAGFIAGLVKTHGKHAVSTDGGTLSASMQIPKTKASYAFIFREKFDRKNNAIYQG